MSYTLKNYKDLINDNCIVLTDRSSINKQMYGTPNFFVIKDKEPYFVTASKSLEKIDYITCGEIRIDADITEVIDAFKSNRYLLVTNKNGTYRSEEHTSELQSRFD